LLHVSHGGSENEYKSIARSLMWESVLVIDCFGDSVLPLGAVFLVLENILPNSM
jgi:hypothetical protein